MRLFESGRRMMEEICGVPVIGVVPYAGDIHIEEEDSVALGLKATKSVTDKVNVAVVLLRHISNFTDFNVLERNPGVNLFYTDNPDALLSADIVIIPGSKSTLSDLSELRRNGLAKAIVSARDNGKTVIGICGGYQIMGIEVSDPDGIEGSLRSLPGLGLLPVKTVLSGSKVTRQVSFSFLGENKPCNGYEIHMGRTETEGKATSLNTILDDGTADGCFVDDRCFGSYIHGLLDNETVVSYLISPYLKEKRNEKFDYTAYKEEQYDLLADHLRKHIDIDKLYKIMKHHD